MLEKIRKDRTVRFLIRAVSVLLIGVMFSAAAAVITLTLDSEKLHMEAVVLSGFVGSVLAVLVWLERRRWVSVSRRSMHHRSLRVLGLLVGTMLLGALFAGAAAFMTLARSSETLNIDAIFLAWLTGVLLAGLAWYVLSSPTSLRVTKRRHRHHHRPSEPAGPSPA